MHVCYCEMYSLDCFICLERKFLEGYSFSLNDSFIGKKVSRERMFHGTKVLGNFAPEERKFHRSESSKERMFHGTKVPRERKFSLWWVSLKPDRKTADKTAKINSDGRALCMTARPHTMSYVHQTVTLLRDRRVGACLGGNVYKKLSYRREAARCC